MIIVLSSISTGQALASQEKIEIAQQAFQQCQVASLPAVDLNKLETNAAALELTNLCLDHYEHLVKTQARYKLQTQNERRMFRIDQESDYAKIDASREVIEAAR